MKKNAITLKGRVSNQEAVVTPAEPAEDLGYKVVGSHPEFPEIEKREGTFSIKVKDDEDKVVYENKVEPFVYYWLPSYQSALRLHGAKLTDDQITFIGEGLKGSVETGKANQELLDILNSAERAASKGLAYSQKYNEKKPKTEEQEENAYAVMLRKYLFVNPGTSDESALEMMHSVNIIPKEFTLADFRSNKAKR